MKNIKLSANHQVLLDKFIQACQLDERIVAALLVGSTIKGTPDEHSDLDLYLITKDEAHDDFDSSRDTFIRLVGDPLFIEDFDIPNIVFTIFSDGSEVEIHYVTTSQAQHVFNEPFKILLDKENILKDTLPEKQETDPTEQTEKLRRLIYWFWHDFSHFVTALARDQLWWGQGQLEVLRSMCVSLARLKNDFSDPEVEGEVYFKIENTMPVETLSALSDTVCPMEKDTMIKAGFKLIQFYREHAKPLAQMHGIAYPEKLEDIMTRKLKSLQ